MIANTALDIRTKEAPAYMRWGKTMAERDLALQLAKEAAIANTPGAQVFAESTSFCLPYLSVSRQFYCLLLELLLDQRLVAESLPLAEPPVSP